MSGNLHREGIPNNIPASDYEDDGGFVGRKVEKKDIKEKISDKKRHPVITISGAGGVGKTALAHSICEDILKHHPDLFEGIVWISAKKDKLTVSGIEEIENNATTFSDVLDAILSTFGFDEFLEKSEEDKESLVNDIIIEYTKTGILLVIDNLETILHDANLLEFIKQIPLPNKVLITSRLGLGEVEKRIPLKEMSINDAIELFRIIAIEKSVKNLAKLEKETIKVYVERMSAYPLVIKWVIGQAALNQDIERVVQKINSTTSDISKFCFEYIFEEMLSENAKKVLLCLAQNDEYLTQAVLMHVIDLSTQEFEDVMILLERASLIIPDQQKDPDDNKIITRYGLLPLTKAYLLGFGTQISREIKEKLQNTQKLFETSRQTTRHYEISLTYLGGKTEEELIATKYIVTALTMYESNYQHAINALNRAIEIAPNFATIYRTWASIESKYENYNTAVEMFEKATRLNRNDATAWYFWGNLEKDQNNYEKAREYFNKALSLVDYKPSVLIALSSVETRSLNFEKAIENLQEAISKIVDHDRDFIVAHTALADAYCRWAETCERENNIDTALKYVDLGLDSIMQISQVDNDSKALDIKMKSVFMLGKLYRLNGDSNKAKLYLEKIVFDNIPQRLSRKQKVFYILACHQLVLILLSQPNADIEQIKKIFYGGFNIAIGTEYEQKYRNIELLFEKERFEGQFVKISDKGYGFIECPEADPKNIFAHISSFIDDIKDMSILQNKWVSFSLSIDNDGKKYAKAIWILQNT